MGGNREDGQVNGGYGIQPEQAQARTVITGLPNAGMLIAHPGGKKSWSVPAARQGIRPRPGSRACLRVP
jgi:hypothetical protein